MPQRSCFNFSPQNTYFMVLTKLKTQSSKVKATDQAPLAPRAILIFKLWFLALSFKFLITANLFAASATAEQAMVVTQHPLATEAALDILKRGGNAADAAITVQLVLNVVEPESSGLGGGGFFLYYDHIKRSVTSLDGRETAPASAHPEMFLRDGQPISFFPERITGGRAVGVPGTPALIQKIYDKHASGVLTLAQLAEPAVKLAEEGVPVSKKMAELLDLHAERLTHFPETKKNIFSYKRNAITRRRQACSAGFGENDQAAGQQKSGRFLSRGNQRRNSSSHQRISGRSRSFYQRGFKKLCGDRARAGLRTISRA